MPGCNGKKCTTTRYYFATIAVIISVKTLAGKDAPKPQWGNLLDQALQKASHVKKKKNIDPSPKQNDVKSDYWELTDNTGCDKGCECRHWEGSTPKKRESEYFVLKITVTTKDGLYKIEFSAYCYTWDYVGICRPKVVEVGILLDYDETLVALAEEFGVWGSKKISSVKPRKQKVVVKKRKTV